MPTLVPRKLVVQQQQQHKSPNGTTPAKAAVGAAGAVSPDSAAVDAALDAALPGSATGGAAWSAAAKLLQASAARKKAIAQLLQQHKPAAEPSSSKRTTSPTTVSPPPAKQPRQESTPNAKMIAAESAKAVQPPLIDNRIQEEVLVEYDPAKPNDYDQYCKERTIKRKNARFLAAKEAEEHEREEREKREREREKRRAADDAATSSSTAVAANLDMSGEEAWMRRARLSGRAPEKPPSPQKVPAANLDVSGEEAWMKRARLSGRAPERPPSPEMEPNKSNNSKKENSDADPLIDKLDGEPWDPLTTPINEYTFVFGGDDLEPPPEKSDERDEVAAAPARPYDPKSGVAARIMARMGWHEGKGLGKEEQGMRAPLICRKIDRRSGVIVEGKSAPVPNNAKKSQQKHKAPQSPSAFIPTRVVLLTNMVGRGEVDERLNREVKEECGKFGSVLCVVVRQLPEAPEDEAVRIFVQFADEDAAAKAQSSLNNRFFGGRVVQARFYDVAKFDAHDYTC
eukprot:TRINITY_DN7997_c0_g1_i1.p1 TRINITY_DN7997_c0_g1~~TRINITY_DN7997_c0_g1_i1.p1  ORF type:complete len:566 (-),score=161.71 TRINITY_DN7997_c0_g1_i1:86-1621(-)